jgi:5-hydroxyisourate hydrolase
MTTPAKRSPITTHILDTTAGLPASNVSVALHIRNPQAGPSSIETINNEQAWTLLGTSKTDNDGRCADLMFVQRGNPEAGIHALVAGATYRLTFATGEYFERKGSVSFFPVAQVSLWFR